MKITIQRYLEVFFILVLTIALNLLRGSRIFSISFWISSFLILFFSSLIIAGLSLIIKRKSSNTFGYNLLKRFSIDLLIVLSINILIVVFLAILSILKSVGIWGFLIFSTSSLLSALNQDDMLVFMIFLTVWAFSLLLASIPILIFLYLIYGIFVYSSLMRTIDSPESLVSRIIYIFTFLIARTVNFFVMVLLLSSILIGVGTFYIPLAMAGSTLIISIANPGSLNLITWAMLIIGLPVMVLVILLPSVIVILSIISITLSSYLQAISASYGFTLIHDFFANTKLFAFALATQLLQKILFFSPAWILRKELISFYLDSVLLILSDDISSSKISFRTYKVCSSFFKEMKFSGLIKIRFLGNESLYLDWKANLFCSILVPILSSGYIGISDRLYKSFTQEIGLTNTSIGNPSALTSGVLKALTLYSSETYRFDDLYRIVRENRWLSSHSKSSSLGSTVSEIAYLASLMKSGFFKKQYLSQVEIKKRQILSNNLQKSDVPAMISILSLITIKSRFSLDFKFYLGRFRSVSSLFFSILFVIYRSLQDKPRWEVEISRMIENQAIIPPKNLREYSEKAIHFSEEVKSLFYAQDSVYGYFSGTGQVPSLNQLSLLCSIDFIEFSFQDYNLRLENPFYRDNLKLIPFLMMNVSCSLQQKEEIFEKLLNQCYKKGLNLNLAFILCCQGKVLIDHDKSIHGQECLRHGIKLYEDLRFSLDSEFLSLNLGDRWIESYSWLVSSLTRSGNVDLAFLYAELSIGRSLSDLIVQKRNGSYLHGEKEQESKIDNLISEINFTNFRLAFLDSNALEKLAELKSATSFTSWLKQIVIQSQRRERFKLIQKLQSLFLKLQDLDNSAALLFSIAYQIQGILDSNHFAKTEASELWEKLKLEERDAILFFYPIYHSSEEMFWGASKPELKEIICFVLFSESERLSLEYILVDESSLIRELQDAINQCIDLIQRNFMKKRNSLDKALTLISEHLLESCIQKLPEYIDKITFIGRGNFHFVPWSTIPLGNRPSNLNEEQMLIDKYRIRSSPSLTLLSLISYRSHLRSTALDDYEIFLAGIDYSHRIEDYLYWSEVEVEIIAQQYQKPILLKNEEVDQGFIETFKRSMITHYSGHANYRSMEKSSITSLDNVYLSFCDRELSAYQILQGMLKSKKSRFIILSACLTGRGDLAVSGSEVLGLERAFFYSGLDSVLSTLWSVPDFATALFMIKFHMIYRSKENSISHLSSTLKDAQVWMRCVTWKELNKEFPWLSSKVDTCIGVYQDLAQEADKKHERQIAKRFSGVAEYFLIVQNRLIALSEDTPFSHPYYWAAFQLKGLG